MGNGLEALWAMGYRLWARYKSTLRLPGLKAWACSGLTLSGAEWVKMRKLKYIIGKNTEEEHLRLDFLDGLSRTIEERINLGWIPLKLPVIDDIPYRIFETTEEYRK